MTIKTYRDPLVSVFQSAAADYCEQVGASPTLHSAVRGQSGGVAVVPAEVFLQSVDAVAAARFGQAAPSVAADLQGQRSLLGTARTAADIAAQCAAIGFKYLEAIVSGDTSSAKRLKGQLESSVCDPRWASTIEAHANYFGVSGQMRTIPYVRAEKVGDRTIEIKEGARIAIIGDWGTGSEPARSVLSSVAEHCPDYLIHLGDIYYSGTSREIQKNFIDVVDDVLRNTSRDVKIFSLSGNHDMYSGGGAYYEMLRTLNAPPYNQVSSFFCLRSGDSEWQFLAMDTGLHDHSPISVSDALTFIEEDEQDWLLKRVQEFSGKTILLSHHQPFSAFSRIGPTNTSGTQATNENLVALYQSLSSSGARIPGWFWGHEHNLCIYEPHLGVKFGRCLGNGAIPTLIEQAPYDPIEGSVNLPRLVPDTTLVHNGSVYANGFALLTLAVGEMRADYFQVLDGNSSKVFSETIR